MKQLKLPNGNGAAMFAQVWMLGTKKKVKDENTWSVLMAGEVELIFKAFPDNYSPLLAEAKEFRSLIASGAATVDHSKNEESAGGDDDSM